MTKNMGTADRAIRTLLAVVIVVLYLTKAISGTAALVLGAFAALFLLTSLVAWCPGYLPFGISTLRKPSGEHGQAL